MSARLASPAQAVVFFGDELVVWPEELAVRQELRDFLERTGGRFRTEGAWRSKRRPRRRPVLVARLSHLDDELALELELPDELYRTAPPGPLCVGVAIGEGAPDPADERRRLEGFSVVVPALRE